MRWLILLVVSLLTAPALVRAQTYHPDDNVSPYHHRFPSVPVSADEPTSHLTTPARELVGPVVLTAAPPPRLPAVEAPQPTPSATPPATTPTGRPQPQAASLVMAAPTAGNALASAAPNMFGDPFALGPIYVRFAPAPVFIPGATRTLQDNVLVLAQGGQTMVGFVPQGTATATGTQVTRLLPTVLGQQQLPSQGTTLAFGQTFNPGTIFLPSGTVIVPAAAAALPATIPLAENAAITGAVATLARPGEQVIFRQGVASNPQQLRIPGRVPAPFLTYDVQQVYDLVTPAQAILRPALVFSIPTPSGGGVVGRTKVSDDNNPLPRDRFILGYDYFDRARLTRGGQDVSRLSPGIEKTFLDGNASVEVRVPFAATLDSNFVADGVTGRNGELGNVHFTFKFLVYASEMLNVAVGSGLAVPTADDVNVRLANGRELLRVRNEAYLIEPYVAALFTPDDRFFAQAWVVFGFQANGNRVEADLGGLGSLSLVGRTFDHSIVQPSLQMGYWLYRSNDDYGLTGLAPFVELHYNATLGGGSAVHSGAFLVDSRQGLDELNVTAGVSTLIGQNFQLMAGIAAPLLQGSDRNRTFDYQIGIRGNLFFGQTASSRAAAARVSSF